MVRWLAALTISSLSIISVQAQERDSNINLELADSTAVKLTGRFVYDGLRPEPKPLEIPVNRKTLTGESYRDADSERFSKLGLKNETLLVGEDRGLQNVVIFVADKNLPVPMAFGVRRETPPARLNFANGRLQPHVLAWWSRNSLELVNDDVSAINLRWDGLDNVMNRLLRPMASVTMTAQPERMPTLIKSDIYPWMLPAVVFPCAHPYFAVSDKEGHFTISNLPPGEWEFRAWHERCGWINADGWQKGRQRVRIGMQSVDLGAIKLAPALFEPKPEPAAAAPARPGAGMKPGWRELGEQRRLLHKKDDGREWIGEWNMLLPAGFQHRVRIVETEDGLLELTADKALNTSGIYAFDNKQLLLVKPRSETSTDDYVWQLNNEGMFVLITDRNKAGARYIGAALEKRAR